MPPSLPGSSACPRSWVRVPPPRVSATASACASMAAAASSPCYEAMDHVSWLADVGLRDRPQVGGKGGSLGELLRAGIAVPPGFVVRTSAFEEFLGTVEAEWPVRARI